MLHVDIPSQADIKALAAHRGSICVSIYIPTTPLTQETPSDRIELKNLVKTAVAAVARCGRRQARDRRHRASIRRADRRRRILALAGAQPRDLRDARQRAHLPPAEPLQPCRGLGPLPPQAAAARGDLPATPPTCSRWHEGAVRLVRGLRRPAADHRQGRRLPKDAASAVGKASINDRSPSGRIEGSEGQKARLRQYARQVDQALRGLLTGSETAADPGREPSRWRSIYRSVNSYRASRRRGHRRQPRAP